MLFRSGDALATIYANSGTDVLTPRVWPAFTIEQQDMMQAETGYSFHEGASIRNYQKEKYQGDIKIRYCFLTGENADYSGMARTYSDILFGREHNGVTGELPLMTDFTGFIEIPEMFMGFSYTEYETLTSFEQMGNIALDLKKSGIKALDVKAQGWFSEGIRHGPLDSINPASRLGGISGFKSLADRLRQNNIGFYPSADVQYVYSNSIGMFGYSSSNTVTMLNKNVGKVYGYNLANFRRETDYDFLYILNPATVTKSMNNYASQLKDWGVTSLSMRRMGEHINADYSTTDFVERQGTLKQQVEALKKLKEQGHSAMISQGNAPLLPYAGKIENFSINSNRFANTDYSVPFTAMVVSGHLPYYGPTTNFRHSDETAMLQYIENGAALSYSLVNNLYDEISKTGYSYLYNVIYENLKNNILEKYNTLYSAIGDVYGQAMVKHERLADNVFQTTYSSGRYVIVNYNTTEVTVNGQKIAALGFVKGGAQ